MEQFSRECLEIDAERHGPSKEPRQDFIAGASMDRVYDNAAKLVKRTLDGRLGERNDKAAAFDGGIQAA